MKPFKFALILAALFSFQAQAADFVYAPKNCEFKVNYPEQPSLAEACNPEDPKDCYEVSNFIQVLAMDSSIRINSTCNNAEPGMLERYNGDVMEYTLGTMAKQRVDEFETGFNDHGIAKQAVVLGNQKVTEESEGVYMAQLWIGKRSVFTIEGQITGVASAEADRIFSSIFQSIRHESWDDAKGDMDEPAVNKQEKPAKEAGE